MPQAEPTLHLIDSLLIHAAHSTADNESASLFFIVLGGMLVAAGIGAIVLVLMRREVAAKEYSTEFESATTSAYDAVRASAPQPPQSLEEELSRVSVTLAAAMHRLRQVSARAEAFEAEVRSLVQRADAARAAAALDENSARNISHLLAEKSEQKLREELTKLTNTHREQIEKLKKAGNRTTWLTFFVGAATGFLLNLLSDYITK